MELNEDGKTPGQHYKDTHGERCAQACEWGPPYGPPYDALLDVDVVQRRCPACGLEWASAPSKHPIFSQFPEGQNQ